LGARDVERNSRNLPAQDLEHDAPVGRLHPREQRRGLPGLCVSACGVHAASRADSHASTSATRQRVTLSASLMGAGNFRRGPSARQSAG